jgi:hypothetical protein
LRIFGCLIYIHVPKDKRKKLEPSGKKGIFVGYSESSKAYRIYVPSQQKVETSRDVTFNENTTFNRSRQSHSDEVHDEDHVAPRIADAEGEPSTFEEAIKKKEWKKAISIHHEK